jgi:hypothetical protein
MAYVILGILAAWWLTSLFASQPNFLMLRKRGTWALLMCLALVLAASPNWWLVGLGSLVILHSMMSPLIDDDLPVVLVGTILMGAYVAVKHVAPMLSVEACLWLIVAGGLGMSAWSLVSWALYPRLPYVLRWPAKQPLVQIHEPHGHIESGQGNVNHAQGLAVVCMAAALGLFAETPWLAVAVCMVLALPIVTTHATQAEWVTQGLVHWAHVGMAMLPFVLGWYTLMVYAVYAGAIVLAWYKGAIRADQGRIGEWIDMLRRAWWNQPWQVKLIGCGMRSWMRVSMAKCRERQRATGDMNQHVWTVAHNEYVQQLLEYGVAGLVCLIGLTLSVLLVSAQIHLGLYLVASALVSIAMISFPWTWIHEFEIPVNSKVNKAFSHGSPGLIFVTWLVVVLCT